MGRSRGKRAVMSSRKVPYGFTWPQKSGVSARCSVTPMWLVAIGRSYRLIGREVDRVTATLRPVTRMLGPGLEVAISRAMPIARHYCTQQTGPARP